VPLAPWNVTLCQVTISAQRAWNDDHDEQVETTSRDARLSVGTSVHSQRTPQLTVGQWVSGSCGSCGSCGSVGQWVMRVSGSVGQWVMRSVGQWVMRVMRSVGQWVMRVMGQISQHIWMGQLGHGPL